MMNGGGRRVLGPRPVNGLKDRDEDLFLFKELQKREKERTVCLLQPVSNDFEANPENLSFYRMSSGKRGAGFEFLRETDKNDYDWLKTPPATPLFQSLDMETNAPDLIVQRELPVVHPISRFSSGNSGPTKVSDVERPKPANPKPNPISNQNSTQSATEHSNSRSTTGNLTVTHLRPKTAEPKNIVRSIPTVNQTVTHSRPATAEAKNILGSGLTMRQNHDHNKRPTTAEAKSTRRPQQSTNPNTTQLSTDQAKRVNTTKPTSQRNFPASNLSKNINGSTVTEPRNRGVSPQVRRSIVIPPQDQSPPSDQHNPILVLSDETPPNLRTDRSLSASRGRPVIKPIKPSSFPDRSTSATRIRPAANTATQKQEPVGSNKAIRRQSCSPSMARGRKVEAKQDQVIGLQTKSSGVGGQVFGSKMVDRLMNARKSSLTDHEKKEIKTVNGGSGGFGRFMSKSSLDIAIKHMDVKRDGFGSR